MTTAPAAAKRGASSRDVVAPAENSAMSRPVGSAVAASSTTISPPPRQRRAGRPGRREEADRRQREVALGEEPAHDGAHLTGGADHADVHAAPWLPVYESGLVGC